MLIYAIICSYTKELALETGFTAREKLSKFYSKEGKDNVIVTDVIQTMYSENCTSSFTTTSKKSFIPHVQREQMKAITMYLLNTTILREKVPNYKYTQSGVLTQHSQPCTCWIGKNSTQICSQTANKKNKLREGPGSSLLKRQDLHHLFSVVGKDEEETEWTKKKTKRKLENLGQENIGQEITGFDDFWGGGQTALLFLVDSKHPDNSAFSDYDNSRRVFMKKQDNHTKTRNNDYKDNNEPLDDNHEAETETEICYLGIEFQKALQSWHAEGSPLGIWRTWT